MEDHKGGCFVQSLSAESFIDGGFVFFVGLALGRSLIPAAAYLTALAFVLLGVAAFFVLKKRAKKTEELKTQMLHDKGRFVLTAGLCLALGASYLMLFSGIYTQRQSDAGQTGRITGRVAAIPEQLEGGSVRLTLADVLIGEKKIKGKLRIYLPASQQAAFRYGDWLQTPDTTLALPSLPRNPGGVDSRMNSWAAGAALMATADEAAWIGHQVSIMDGLLAFRERLLENVRAQMDEKSFGALQGMLFGDDSGMDDEWMNAYRATGVAHVLSVSGLHVGMVAGALTAIFKRIKNWKLGLFASLAGVWFYCALCGFSPPVSRSAILFGMLILGRFWGARSDGLTSWAASALPVLLYNPFVLFGASFQFSYSAVLGILVFSPTIERALKRLPIRGKIAKGIKASLAVSLGAQIALMPSQLQVFGTMPLLSVLMNLIVIPVADGAVLLGFAGSLLACIHPVLGAIPLFLADLCVKLMGGLTAYVARWKWAIWTPGAMPIWALIAFVLLCFGLWTFAKNKRWRTGFFLAGTAMLLIGFPVSQLIQAQKCEMVFLDVGQGDAAHIRQGTANILIDGGAKMAWQTKAGDLVETDAGKNTLLPYFQKQGITHLDAVIVSHGDADHCGGLLVVLQEMQVDMLLTGPDDPQREDDAVYYELLAKAEEKGIPRAILSSGDSFSLGSAQCQVLWPEDWQGESNASSLMLLWDYYGKKSLFTGDIGIAEEEKVPGLEAVDVLKVAHHGSAYSTGESFLAQTQPQVAIISAGANNRYGHPAPAALERLWRNGAEVFSTSEVGAVTILFEKNGEWSLHTMKSTPQG